MNDKSEVLTPMVIEYGSEGLFLGELPRPPPLFTAYWHAAGIGRHYPSISSTHFIQYLPICISILSHDENLIGYIYLELYSLIATNLIFHTVHPYDCCTFSLKLRNINNILKCVLINIVLFVY